MISSYLKPADERVVDLVGEELRPSVLDARPSPHVLVAADPHDHAHDEPTDGEERVIDSDLLGPPVAATAVSNKDEDADEQRQARCGEYEALRPDAGARGPGR
ncbi:hypothetical protein FJTKL_10267 [Diaporthe vaccinii]|uniref:Uncharacterized protein n=1 Tax=Diaporthe vaccinii TaxID=105482 RepID=A0ABR4EKD4_9PEZI